MGAMALKSLFFFVSYLYKIPGSGFEFNIPQGPGDHVSTDDEDVDDVCGNHDDEQQNNLDYEQGSISCWNLNLMQQSAPVEPKRP